MQTIRRTLVIVCPLTRFLPMHNEHPFLRVLCASVFYFSGGSV
jgi:hypothetical protein